MSLKKLSVFMGAALLSVGLVGCSTGSNLPEGDVKVVKQEVSGVISLLLESANYGPNHTTVASMVLPQDSQYTLNVTMEEYENGELVNTRELANHTTDMITKESIVHVIMNAGMGVDEQSIFSIAEVDSEKTTDTSSPEYKSSKSFETGIDYDEKVDLVQVGTDLGEEVVVTAYVKYKADATEKAPITLETYKDEVSNYEKVSVLKVKVVAK
ncbi:MAG TPA: hypothetical protein DCY20_06315 [Firmicutes bacterium]|nr:hypothetical protein [Bacillota bacterium]